MTGFFFLQASLLFTAAIFLAAFIANIALWTTGKRIWFWWGLVSYLLFALTLVNLNVYFFITYKLIIYLGSNCNFELGPYARWLHWLWYHLVNAVVVCHMWLDPVR